MLKIFKRTKPSNQENNMPMPDFSDNWKAEQYDKNVLICLERLRKGQKIVIFDDGRGYELAAEVKRQFILEYSKQLSERISITSTSETIHLCIKGIEWADNQINNTL